MCGAIWRVAAAELRDRRGRCDDHRLRQASPRGAYPRDHRGSPCPLHRRLAFWHCASLTSITIPEGVTSIGDEAFASCSSLTSITMPEGVTSIGDYAFLDCTSLTSINLPGMFQLAGELWRMRATAALIFGENDLLSYAQGYNQIVITDWSESAAGELVIPDKIEGFHWIRSRPSETDSSRRRCASHP